MYRNRLIRIILPLVLMAAVLFVAMPRGKKFSYDYKKGTSWKYDDLVAAFDFPLLKTREQMQEQSASSGSEAIPFYVFSDKTASEVVDAVMNLDMGRYNSLKPVIGTAIRSVYSHGVLPDAGMGNDVSEVYIKREKKASLFPVAEIFSLQGAGNAILADVAPSIPAVNADSLLEAYGIYALIIPNLVFDSQTTELVHYEQSNVKSPTLGYVSAGTLIVSKGEIITSDIAQMLDSYKSEYNATMGSRGSEAKVRVGNMLLAILLVGILFLVIFFTGKKILANQNQYLFVLLVWLIAALGAVLVCRTNEDILFLLPFTLAALYLESFFTSRSIVFIYATALLPLLVFAQNGIALYVIFFFGGLVAILSFKRFNRGWQQFLTAAFTFLALWLGYLAFYLTGLVGGNLVGAGMMLFLSPLLAVAGYPLIYLFEKLFNLLSNSRLMELCDTSNPLIRKLEQMAPGTFQHSLQVMSLSEAAARAIGENTLLVRTGALYHDIGKMRNPLCFVENRSLLGAEDADYHDGITPLQSAQDIIRHVSDGCEIATKEGLPHAIVNFIISHHGTTCVSYFYDKYCREGGDASIRPEFCYDGIRPVTKAEIIVMLADSLEAASRTLKNYQPESVSELVENIVSIKMDEGQFVDAEISVGELTVIKETFKSYIVQMHHERVIYPKGSKYTKKI
ncbi:MAG: HDIG domain-containing protein [Bacteroidales bacterium]|nr:HDIG domain-containing protein [Bacteroidales bacterium]